MNSLNISLGHNSSVVFQKNGQLIGYEQERLDQIKSSSQSPNDALLEIIKNVSIKDVKSSEVFVSHWFDNFPKKENLKSKYFDRGLFSLLKDLNCEVRTQKENFTHHDAHAFSSFSFFTENIEFQQLEKLNKKGIHYVVCDGFGNNQEVISIYKSDSVYDEPVLLNRIYGYNKSLGLMYQYATSFTGMKENQDEYKFLGYESYITLFLKESQINSLINFVKNDFFSYLSLDEELELASGGKLINTTSLLKVKENWHKIFQNLLKYLNKEQCEEFEKRSIIGFAIQYCIEQKLLSILNQFNVESVVLSGGCFYNVKLNNFVLKNISSLFCVMPLAGDQGSSFGFLSKNDIKFKYNDLCYGNRNLFGIDKSKNSNCFYTAFDFIEFVSNKISENQPVNIIRNKMEFGPRALCNTTTLLRPTKQNVDFNNRINGRNEVMPCAPIIRRGDMGLFFKEEEYSRVVGSDKFMILTYDYTLNNIDHISGVAHKHPLENVYTGRPQIVEDNSVMGIILNEVPEKCLVNTSFNVHGRPICFNTSSILQNHEFQLNNAKKENRTIDLVILQNEK